VDGKRPGSHPVPGRRLGRDRSRAAAARIQLFRDHAIQALSHSPSIPDAPFLHRSVKISVAVLRRRLAGALGGGLKLLENRAAH
jgi:hypothetical protein